ncbi:MAG: Stf0 sulfotransferase family protein [Elainella sp. Prado103]|jgi:LPS sulfotransferase NodH|nr:Stf0 sulfotransferase family protein [Elainella sp. Prado103]
MNLEKTYIICATQRSGSTLLCHLLASTHQAGSPKEYLLPAYKSQIPFDGENYLQYVKGNLAAYASANGVSGVKMMEKNFSDLLKRLHSSHHIAGNSHLETLRDVFPGVKFIFITRRNKLRQAISLSRAEQTNQWEKHACSISSTEKNQRFFITPFYVKSAVQRVLKREAEWRNFFQDNGITPYIITYEELVRNPTLHIHKILDFLEIPNVTEVEVSSPTLRRQADFYTEFLILYYRSYFLLRHLLPEPIWQLAQRFKNQYL